MSVLQIIDLDIHNPEMYAQYTAQVSEIVQRYGGRYLVRGGKVLSATGGLQPKRVVVIAFESVEKLRECYASPEYQAIVHLRSQSSTSKSIIVEGT
ncbi:MAG: DUF1330 domain-containing protein [Chloroflexota bacterium]